MKKITINELSEVFKKITEKLTFELDNYIDIEEDLYLYIPTEEWSNYVNVVIETGSLYDDIDNLKKLSIDKSRPITYADFDRLASLLRAISYKNNPPLK